MACRNEEKDAMKKKKNLHKFSRLHGLSNDDVGVATGTVCQDIRPEAGFETGELIEEKLGGLP